MHICKGDGGACSAKKRIIPQMAELLSPPRRREIADFRKTPTARAAKRQKKTEENAGVHRTSPNVLACPMHPGNGRSLKRRCPRNYGGNPDMKEIDGSLIFRDGVWIASRGDSEKTFGRVPKRFRSLENVRGTGRFEFHTSELWRMASEWLESDLNAEEASEKSLVLEDAPLSDDAPSSDAELSMNIGEAQLVLH